LRNSRVAACGCDDGPSAWAESEEVTEREFPPGEARMVARALGRLTLSI
jgi:hypothetical protein